MDTVTHALSGALLGRLFSSGRGGLRPAAAIAAGATAAAFPDIDYLLGYVSELTYLRGHRGVTHSVLLLPLWGALLAWLFARLARLRDRRGPDWRAFYGLACAGIAIHIAGDLITQFGTMILAPLSDRRFGIGTTFIIDLVFTGIILAGLAASAVFRRSRVPAALALAALAGRVGVGWVGRGEAIEAARAYAVAKQIPVVAIDAAPRPASPFNWTAIVFDGERYHYAHLNTRRQHALTVREGDNFIRRFSAPYLPVAQAQWAVKPVFGKGGEGELARAVWNAGEFAFYRWFAMFPVLDQVDAATPAGPCASFRDLRFETPGRDGTPFRYGLCGTGNGQGWRLFERRDDGGLRWVAGG